MCPLGRLAVVTTSGVTVFSISATGAEVCVPTVTVTENVYVCPAVTAVPEIRPLELSVNPEPAGKEPDEIAHTAVPIPPPVYASCWL